MYLTPENFKYGLLILDTNNKVCEIIEPEYNLYFDVKYERDGHLIDIKSLMFDYDKFQVVDIFECITSEKCAMLSKLCDEDITLLKRIESKLDVLLLASEVSRLTKITVEE